MARRLDEVDPELFKEEDGWRHAAGGGVHAAPSLVP